ncbi:pimeloyl-ACP methyl ester carboxylesterase [Streptomyces glaucescens]
MPPPTSATWAASTAPARPAAPVLVLAGGLDGGPSPAPAHRAGAVLPHAECLVQPGAGHYPWPHDPGWFADRGDAFLSAPDAAAARAHR